MLKKIWGQFTARQMDAMVKALEAWREQHPEEPFPLARMKRCTVYKREDGKAEIEFELHPQ